MRRREFITLVGGAAARCERGDGKIDVAADELSHQLGVAAERHVIEREPGGIREGGGRWARAGRKTSAGRASWLPAIPSNCLIRAPRRNSM